MKKKTFKGAINPAMTFIDTSAAEREERPSEAAETMPAGKKANPAYIETRSKRLQLLLQPSLHKKLKERAQAVGVSVNELINEILAEAMEKE